MVLHVGSHQNHYKDLYKPPLLSPHLSLLRAVAWAGAQISSVERCPGESSMKMQLDPLIRFLCLKYHNNQGIRGLSPNVLGFWIAKYGRDCLVG